MLRLETAIISDITKERGLGWRGPCRLRVGIGVVRGDVPGEVDVLGQILTLHRLRALQ